MRSAGWALVVVAAAVAGCGGTKETVVETEAAPVVVRADPWEGVTDAVAWVRATAGHSVNGIVHFSQAPGGVHVVAEFSGLKPNSQHAFHIHEFGDVSGSDGKSAGGHYNPEGHQHGGPDSPVHHAGDLGNLVSDADGNARYDHVVAGLSVAGDHHPVVGRSVVVHAGPDDLMTQPTGTTPEGASRVAFGVIGVGKSATR